MTYKRVLIVGASGRDYHNFITVFRDDPAYKVVGFTHAQLPVEKEMFPKELAGNLYKNDIPIYDEKMLESIVKKHNVDIVCLSYSDLSHIEVMHIASRALAAGASFMLLGPKSTMIRSKKKVIAVCATRTGAGKSPMTEYISKYLSSIGKNVSIVRHPMPYGNLIEQEVQVFRTIEDLDRNKCTLEEREDYERHIRNGFTVYAGVDYKKILRLAEKHSDIIIWDGGNNDFPFFVPDLMITVADAIRAGHETLYHPGEVNFRMCDVIAVNKWEYSRKGENVVRENAKLLNPNATVIRMSLEHAVEGNLQKNMRVIIVEDGPTITHGGMPYGIGYIVAKKARCDILDGRKYAKGIYKKIYEQYPHIEKVVPAIGYSKNQIADLRKTILSSRPDGIICATPTNISNLLDTNIPVINIKYRVKRNKELEEILWKFAKS
ncbi:MAG: GTPase [Candidatus Micrarchaeia archaeon]